MAYLCIQEDDMFGIGSVGFDDLEIVPEHLIQKGNYHGIGYQPLNPTEALHTKVKESRSVKATTKSGNKLSFMGQVGSAFKFANVGLKS